MTMMDKLKGLVSGAQAETPLDGEVGSTVEDGLDVEITPPAAEAVTCRIHFSQPVSPGGTSLFETPEDAAAWPAVRALLGIPGVHSVIGKGDVLVMARRQDIEWSEILDRVEGALREVARGPAKLERPAADPLSQPRDEAAEAALRERVEECIREQINPALDSHGGYIELLDVHGTRLFIHMGGGCQGCAMSSATLKQGVETMLRSEIPEISEVLDTTDHGAGENPYFAG